MGFLRRKPKVSVDEFCQWYFDTTLFSEEAQAEIFDHVFNFIVEVDQSFAAIDKTLFEHEMTALYMELFGLAWDRRYEKWEHILPAIVATKKYLEQRGKLEIWDTMLAYNHAIAQSGADSISGEQAAKELTAGLNYIRARMAKMLEEKGYEAECAARAANRQGIEAAWKSGITHNRLIASFLDRLKCNIDLNADALNRLVLSTYAICEGATRAMEKVRMSFSD